jgi:hypothetical protein
MGSTNPAHEYCQRIGIQARTTNTGTVRFSVNNDVPTTELAAGNSAQVLVNTPKNVWVESDNGTEQINIEFMQGPLA